MNPKLKVTVFKASGKYYTSEATALKDIHYHKCVGFSEEHQEDIDKNYVASQRLLEAIKCNAEEARCYSGLINGFSSGFIYVLDVDFPDHEEGFFTYLIDKT